jgi:hypothetical protein
VVVPGDPAYPASWPEPAMIENRFVHLPESAPWLVQRPNALTVFAHGRHGDQIDAIVQNEPSDRGLIPGSRESPKSYAQQPQTSCHRCINLNFNPLDKACPGPATIL